VLHEKLTGEDISVGDTLALRFGQRQRELVHLPARLLLPLQSLNLSQDSFPLVGTLLVEANPVLMVVDSAFMKSDFVEDGLGEVLVHDEQSISPVPTRSQATV
jgi:hypothetical protein